MLFIERYAQMHKSLSAVALAGCLALTLAGCGSGSSSSTTAPASNGQTTSAQPAGGSTLTVWVDANRQPVLQSAADAFTKATGTKVELQTHDFTKIKDDFITEVGAGKGPDVTIGANDWTGKFVQNGAIAPVELGSKASTFQDVAVKAMTSNGKVYGVPYSIENVALVRNTELAPQAPATFDDLLKTGENLVSEGKADAVFAAGDAKATAADSFHLYPLQTSFGAPVFEQKTDGSYDPTKLAMNNDGGTKFAEYMGKMAQGKDYDLNMTGDIALQKFKSGKLPYFITGPWNIAEMKKAGIKYSIDPVPSAGGSAAQPFVGVQGFYVSAKSKNTIAAQKFVVDYLGTKDVQSQLFEIGNRAPAQKDAYAAAQSDPDVAAFGKVGTNGVPMPNVPQMDQVWSDWGATEAKILSGKSTDPAADWKSMCDSIATKIK